jgi:hypothetical protein
VSRYLLDNDLYIERRLALADEDAARVAMLAGLNARRLIAINEAERRLREIAMRCGDSQFVRTESQALIELLSAAKRERATDPPMEVYATAQAA